MLFQFQFLYPFHLNGIVFGVQLLNMFAHGARYREMFWVTEGWLMYSALSLPLSLTFPI